MTQPAKGWSCSEDFMRATTSMTPGNGTEETGINYTQEHHRQAGIIMLCRMIRSAGKLSYSVAGQPGIPPPTKPGNGMERTGNLNHPTINHQLGLPQPWPMTRPGAKPSYSEARTPAAI